MVGIRVFWSSKSLINNDYCGKKPYQLKNPTHLNLCLAIAECHVNPLLLRVLFSFNSLSAMDGRDRPLKN